MATLTLKQYLDKIRKQNAALIKENVPLGIAARSAHAAITTRIFHEGKATDGSAIGPYSNKELWASDSQLRSSGTHRGKTGNPTKTSYYKNYTALKRQQNFTPPNMVNLRMRNELQSDFANVGISPGNNGIVVPKTKKETPFLYVIIINKEINIDKMDGAEDHFKTTIFQHSKAERKIFKDVIRKELIRFLKK